MAAVPAAVQAAGLAEEAGRALARAEALARARLRAAGRAQEWAWEADRQQAWEEGLCPAWARQDPAPEAEPGYRAWARPTVPAQVRDPPLAAKGRDPVLVKAEVLVLDKVLVKVLVKAKVLVLDKVLAKDRHPAAGKPPVKARGRVLAKARVRGLKTAMHPGLKNVSLVQGRARPVKEPVQVRWRVRPKMRRSNRCPTGRCPMRTR